MDPIPNLYASPTKTPSSAHTVRQGGSPDCRSSMRTVRTPTHVTQVAARAAKLHSRRVAPESSDVVPTLSFALVMTGVVARVVVRSGCHDRGARGSSKGAFGRVGGVAQRVYRDGLGRLAIHAPNSCTPASSGVFARHLSCSDANLASAIHRSVSHADSPSNPMSVPRPRRRLGER